MQLDLMGLSNLPEITISFAGSNPAMPIRRMAEWLNAQDLKSCNNSILGSTPRCIRDTFSSVVERNIHNVEAFERVESLVKKIHQKRLKTSRTCQVFYLSNHFSFHYLKALHKKHF